MVKKYGEGCLGSLQGLGILQAMSLKHNIGLGFRVSGFGIRVEFGFLHPALNL